MSATPPHLQLETPAQRVRLAQERIARARALIDEAHGLLAESDILLTGAQGRPEKSHGSLDDVH
jgi:hypothetical protein